MLDLRCILCLIHTDIRIQVLKICQKLPIHPQHLIGIQHLIIIIHQVRFPHLLTICLINSRYLYLFFFFQLLYLFFCQHHIFDIRNQRSYILQITLRRISHSMFLADIYQHFRRLFFILYKFKRSFTDASSIILDDPCTDTIDRTEFQTSCKFFPKTRGKPLSHILCCRYGICNRQYPFRSDAFAIDHISQTCNQYGSLPGSRHSKKQYRPFCALYCFLLLFVQLYWKCSFKFFPFHYKRTSFNARNNT